MKLKTISHMMYEKFSSASSRKLRDDKLDLISTHWFTLVFFIKIYFSSPMDLFAAFAICCGYLFIDMNFAMQYVLETEKIKLRHSTYAAIIFFSILLCSLGW